MISGISHGSVYRAGLPEIIARPSQFMVLKPQVFSEGAETSVRNYTTALVSTWAFYMSAVQESNNHKILEQENITRLLAATFTA